MANELITWLRSKTFVLALLRAAHFDATGMAKTVIRAVLTWWTAHFQAYRQLLELKASLISICSADAARVPATKQIVTGDAKAKRHAYKMISVIMDPLFWHAITRYGSQDSFQH